MNNSKREINNFKKNLKEEFYLAFEEITINLVLIFLLLKKQMMIFYYTL